MSAADVAADEPVRQPYDLSLAELQLLDSVVVDALIDAVYSDCQVACRYTAAAHRLVRRLMDDTPTHDSLLERADRIAAGGAA